jgi:hypothetical protein
MPTARVMHDPALRKETRRRPRVESSLRTRPFAGPSKHPRDRWRARAAAPHKGILQVVCSTLLGAVAPRNVLAAKGCFQDCVSRSHRRWQAPEPNWQRGAHSHFHHFPLFPSLTPPPPLFPLSPRRSKFLKGRILHSPATEILKEMKQTCFESIAPPTAESLVPPPGGLFPLKPCNLLDPNHPTPPTRLPGRATRSVSLSFEAVQRGKARRPCIRGGF